VRRVKETLISLGAGQALLSGSGASVFGLFDRKETRQAAMKALDNEINWRKFAVATISRSKYREALEQVY
jgi:4-diphosphocytidyl-2C-methyl-D-erythritol kinase